MNDDTISRQLAIEKLERNRSLFCKNRVEFQMLSITDKSRVDEIDTCIAELLNLPSAQQWIPVSELPNDNREVEVTCEVKRLDGKKYRYTCHASYVHRYSIESTGYNNWEECDEYNEEEDMYYALPGWYERVHNWDEYSYCAIEDYVLAWRELSEPYKGEQE